MRFQELYQKEVLPALIKEFGYKNRLAVPKISKVSINVGVGRMTKDKSFIDAVVNTLTRITGQKPVLTKARKSISAFKVREGNIVGVAITLRGKRMADFLDKLVNITFPRVRDFRGLNEKIVDRTGNATVGFREHLSFPEVKADEVDSLHGLEVNITTTAKTKAEGLALLKLLGFPFKKSV